MQKSSVLLIIVGGLVGIGIVTSFYGNQIIFEDLSKSEGVVKAGESLKVESELDELSDKRGIYAVQILEFKDGAFTASVYDPIGIKIEEQEIDEEVLKERLRSCLLASTN